MRQLTVALAILAFCTVGRATSPPDATAYQITVDHAGVTTSGGTLALQLTPRWTQALPGPGGYPLIVGYQVYVVAGGLLYAFNVQTGATVWGPIQVPSAVGITYDSGTLFVVSESGLVTYSPRALGRRAGAASSGNIYSAPHLRRAMGFVYVGGAGSGGTLDALNETSGAILWSAGVENGDNSSPAIGPNAVYVAMPFTKYLQLRSHHRRPQLAQLHEL